MIHLFVVLRKVHELLLFVKPGRWLIVKLVIEAHLAQYKVLLEVISCLQVVWLQGHLPFLVPWDALRENKLKGYV